MYEIQNFIFLFLFLSFFLASRSSEWLVTSKIIIIFFKPHWPVSEKVNFKPFIYVI